MSADNGIYILETDTDSPEGREYRVAHLSAVENMDYVEGRGYVHDPDVQIVNAREMWADCKVYSTVKDALLAAKDMYDKIMADDFAVIEYGIQIIRVTRKF